MNLSDFRIRLSSETWDNVFDNTDLNSMYNSFLNTYLRAFYTSFPLKKLVTKTNSNAWITTGIRTSCKHKRKIYLLCRNSKNPLLIKYYKLYCRTLVNVIREAKKIFFNTDLKLKK